MGEYKHIKHDFEPLYDEKSQILILGSFPSVKSREQGFYYGHPQNRFWKVISNILNTSIPQNIDEKKKMLHDNHIALWDVIESCDIIGSSDSSIKNVIVNNFDEILEKSKIKKIYANGKTAGKLYKKYCEKKLDYKIIELPSTSPANAVYNLDKLINEWNVILKDIVF